MFKLNALARIRPLIAGAAGLLVAVGAQVSGQVKRLHVVLGQRVQAGDLIAEVDSQPQRIALRPGQQTRFAYRLKPLVRGHFHFQRCELTLPSPLRLWQARRLQALPVLVAPQGLGKCAAR